MSNNTDEVLSFLRGKNWQYNAAQGNGKVRTLLRALDFPALLEFCTRIKAEGGIGATVEIYKDWIEQNKGRSPLIFAAWFNLGVELASAGDDNAAQICYRNALVLKPDLYQASINLGLTLERQGKPAEAMAAWTQALQPDDARTMLLNHQGRLLELQREYVEAEKKLYASLLTNPDQPEACEHWSHIRQKMCAWPVFGNGIPGMSQDDLDHSPGALAILALTDDVKLQGEVVAKWIDKKVPAAPERLAPEKGGYGHKKIRLGYLSSDYCRHPVSYLVAEMFERHDRDRFEVYGYCSTNDDGSDVRARILAAFDKYTIVKGMSDEQAARAIRADEIDVLIDLNGVTAGTRLPVLRWRPAPVQLTYIGYIGPVPLPELDYFPCDEFAVPKEVADLYQPKPLYLPGSYQVNDSKLSVAATPTRAQMGLPDDKFVFCSFSNTYKITEEMFTAWMSILARTPNSVLWMLADNDFAKQNMIKQAVKCGVDPYRIIFAGRVEPSLYLARMKCADLFLDSFPYNAGTTASDALRVGCPLITRSGQAFASRMAGSLLKAVGLEQGITHSLEDYIELAVKLGSDKAAYATFRASLAPDAWEKSIGNIEAFTKRMEDAYRGIWKG